MVECAQLSARDLEIVSGGALAGLSPEALAALRSAATSRGLGAGEVLIREGEPAEQLYLLVEGSLSISLDEIGQQLGELEPGAVVGEVAVLSGTPRTATVRATSAARLAVLERADLERIATDEPAIIDGLLASSIHRLRRSQLAAILHRLLGPTPPDLLDALMARMTYQRLAGGEVLFRPGDPGDSAFIVLSGRLRVISEPTLGGPGRIEEIGRGQTIWGGLLSTRSRNQTAIAIRDTEVGQLTRDLVGWLTATVPEAAIRIMAELADRMERAAAAPAYSSDRAATFAILASPAVDAAAVVPDVERALAAHGRVLELRSRDVRVIGGDVPPSHCLDELEAGHDFVIYVTDPTLTPWTEQCLRQADHILVIGDATADPAPGPVERELPGRWSREATPRRTLVLLQDPGIDEPRGTSTWLDARSRGLEVDQHLHVRRGHAGDLARLGRLLAGQGVTLVLGGGGARGYAHIGVVRAMEEIGIPIDMVAGTSMGALVAALVARGRPAQRIEDDFASLGAVFDVTLPLASISSGGRIRRAIEGAHGDAQIEDTWLPFFCVSTNLTEAKPVIHRRGLLAHALRASSSLPGILPPVYEAGSLLVDGGLLDTLPVGVMRTLNGGGPVIAVDVSPPVDVAAGAPFPDDLSGWRLLWQRLRHRRRPPTVPGIAELLQRTVAVPGLYLRTQRTGATPDVLIQPQVSRWRMLDFGRVRPIVQAGHAGAVEPLRTWWVTHQGLRNWWLTQHSRR